MRFSRWAFLVAAVGLFLTASAGYAATFYSFTMPGETFTTAAQGGYEYSITTDGVDGVREQGDANNGLSSNLNIADEDWSRIGQEKGIVVRGAIPAGGLSSMLSNTVLQIGLVTRSEAERDNSDGTNFLSQMVYNSAYAEFYVTGSTSKVGHVLGADNSQTAVSPIASFDITQALHYEMFFERSTSTLFIRAGDDTAYATWDPLFKIESNGLAEYESWSHVQFGVTEWNASYSGSDAPEVFTESALLIQMQNSRNSGSSTATFGNIYVAAIPEPVTALFFATGMCGVWLFSKRRTARAG